MASRHHHQYTCGKSSCRATRQKHDALKRYVEQECTVTNTIPIIRPLARVTERVTVDFGALPPAPHPTLPATWIWKVPVLIGSPIDTDDGRLVSYFQTIRWLQSLVTADDPDDAARQLRVFWCTWIVSWRPGFNVQHVHTMATAVTNNILLHAYDASYLITDTAAVLALILAARDESLEDC